MLAVRTLTPAAWIFYRCHPSRDERCGEDQSGPCARVVRTLTVGRAISRRAVPSGLALRCSEGLRPPVSCRRPCEEESLGAAVEAASVEPRDFREGGACGQPEKWSCLRSTQIRRASVAAASSMVRIPMLQVPSRFRVGVAQGGRCGCHAGHPLHTRVGEILLPWP